jgi:hypothetical protein
MEFATVADQYKWLGSKIQLVEGRERNARRGRDADHSGRAVDAVVAVGFERDVVRRAGQQQAFNVWKQQRGRRDPLPAIHEEQTFAVHRRRSPERLDEARTEWH